MASDKSMYWLAAGVLALGIGTRYGHDNSPNQWAVCAFQRTTGIFDRVTDRINSQVERNVMVLNDRQSCANDRAAAAVARAQARATEVMARREAANARVQAAIARINSRVMRIEVSDDSE